MKRLSFFMIILLIPAVCFSATESIIGAETPPAYNECDGMLIELIPAGDAITFSFTIAKGVMPSNSLIGDPITFGFTISQGSTLTYGTESIFSAETPPVYNACDGALIETISGTPIIFGFTIAEGQFEVTMSGTPVSFGFTIAKPQQKIHFSQGITFDQGIIFDGGNYLRWSGNRNVTVLAP